MMKINREIFRPVRIFCFVAMVLTMITLATSCSDSAGPGPSGKGLPEGWTELASMPIPLTKHAVTVLKDGRILVCGGETVENTQVVPARTAFIYDPVKNTWSATGLMNIYRVFHNIVTLKDGRVLVWGGYNSKTGGQNYLMHGEIFDPATGQWTLTPNATSEMGPYPGMILWDNGLVSIIGRTSTTRYHPANNTVTLDSGGWSSLLNQNGVTPCHVNDSSYLLFGGDAANGSFYSRFVQGNKVFDRLTNGKHSWSNALRLPGQRILVMGGNSSICEIYDYSAHVWNTIAKPFISYGNVALFMESSGTVLAFGNSDVSRLDIQTMLWSDVAAPEGIDWGTGKSLHAVLLANGSYFICGGVVAGKIPAELLSSAYLFRP